MTTTDETPVEPVADEADQPDATSDETAEDSPNREAARYRRALREAETERDALRAQLDTTRRALVEHGIGNVPAAAFWTLNPDPGALLDDDGNVSPEKVGQAARDAFTSLGLPGTWRDPARRGALGPYVPGEGATPTGAPGRDSFESAFGPASV